MPRNPQEAVLVRAHHTGWKHQIWVDSLDLIGPLYAHLGAAAGDTFRFGTAISLTLAHLRCRRPKAGMADVLALAPASTAGWAELRDRFAAMVGALLPLQRVAGVWHIVVDRPKSLADPTLAAMMVITVRRASSLFYDPRTDTAIAAAVQAVRRLTCDGVLSGVSDATPVGQYSTYATRPVGQFP